MTQTPFRGDRRSTLKALGAGVAILGAPAIVRGQTPSTIKVGWAISKTGPFAGGASITQWPNYQLWIKDVNDAGGFNLGGRRVLLEGIEYDDRSQAEEAIRACERLVNQDKVDFMLPPWGTGQNLAVAPIFRRANMPQLAASLVSDRIPEIVKNWNNLFALLNTASTYAEAAVEALRGLRAAGRIGDTVAMVHVTDAFGLELSNAARRAFGAAGFKLTYDKGYPLGTSDLAPIIAEAERANADTFIAFSYPPDTVGLTEASRVRGFNPKVFYVAVGSAFPIYRDRFKENVEGVMGIGGWNPDATPQFRQYVARHVELHKREPDRWGSSLFYAGLQALQQATEKIGKLDRAAIINELDTASFNTIVGPLSFKDNIRVGGFFVGQWQDGDFVGVGPAQPGAKAIRFPKPNWRA
jgi:branched-chain amino acid transport system substrate-binding protein